MAGIRTASLHLRAALRLVRRYGLSPRRALEPLDERVVFVIGCPRSGTTFLAGAIGSLAGFVDLGEVAPLKAAIPALHRLPEDEAARRIRGILAATRRLGLVGGRRAVEQTPETAFVAAAAGAAFPQAGLVHIVRDGRDVVCSLLDRGWLRAGRGGGDDAGLPYGAEARFWVEPGREGDFSAASDARRAAWAWRRYVSAAKSAPAGRVHEVRYELLSSNPDAVAADLAEFLGAPVDRLADALRGAHGASVGRWRRDLTAAELAEIEAECGELLAALGYLR